MCALFAAMNQPQDGLPEPTCHTHGRKYVCCCTCGNVPVCMACDNKKHEGHQLHHVSEIANRERKSIRIKLTELNIEYRKLQELKERIKSANQQLTENFATLTEQLRVHYEPQIQKITLELEESNARQIRDAEKIEIRRANERDQITNFLEGKLGFRLTQAELMQKAELPMRKYDKQLKESQQKHHEIDKGITQKIDNAFLDWEKLTANAELLRTCKERQLQHILDVCEGITKGYENFKTTASSFLSANDEWTDAQFIPDLERECEPLIKAMKTQFPEIKVLSNFRISDIAKPVVDDITLTENEESVVDVVGIKSKVWNITGVTSDMNGSIVITGSATKKYSHITVIDANGKVQRHENIKREMKTVHIPDRFCTNMLRYQVVTVSAAGGISTYNVCNGTTNETNIVVGVRKWPKDRFLACVTTDPVRNIVLVGTNSRDVYVFDDNLMYIQTIVLPGIITGSFDIAGHVGNLLVCDYVGRTAYVVTIQGTRSTVMFELTKPCLDVGDYRPLSVCTDKRGFVYMLWDNINSSNMLCILAQYSQDGRHLLKTRNVDSNSRCVTICEVKENEKLLIATYTSGKIYTYGITVNENK